MATAKKKTTQSKVKMKDLKPSKDAKGGAKRPQANKGRTSLNRVKNLN